jgi:hypothetical protein
VAVTTWLIDKSAYTRFGSSPDAMVGRPSRFTLEGVSGVHVDEGDGASSVTPPTTASGVAVDAAAIEADRRRAVRAALADGENSGESIEFNFDDFLGRMRIKKFRRDD